jgi:hypothetical protein
VVDDVQWADVASLDLLHYVTRRWVAGGVPILLLGIVRSEAVNAPTRGEWAIADWLTPLAHELPVICLSKRTPIVEMARPGHQAMTA